MKTTKQTQDAFIASLMPDSDKKMVRISGASLIVALALGFWASTYESIIDEVMFDPPEKDQIGVSVKMDPIEKKPDPPKKPKVQEEITRRRPGGGGKPKGDGDPRAPINRGVLERLTAMTNTASAQAYDLANKTFAKDIEKTLKVLNGLQVTGKTSLAERRRGKADVGFNPGSITGSGGGIGDMLSGLLGGPAGTIKTQAKMKNMPIPKMNEIDMGSTGASRSASEIMKVVKQRTPGLRHIYNTHLKKKPGFQGKVTLKLTIAPGGEIISIAVANSTTGFTEFDNAVKSAVSKWTFNKIKSGNTTVTIPFTFTE